MTMPKGPDGKPLSIPSYSDVVGEAAAERERLNDLYKPPEPTYSTAGELPANTSYEPDHSHTIVECDWCGALINNDYRGTMIHTQFHRSLQQTVLR